MQSCGICTLCKYSTFALYENVTQEWSQTSHPQQTTTGLLSFRTSCIQNSTNSFYLWSNRIFLEDVSQKIHCNIACRYSTHDWYVELNVVVVVAWRLRSTCRLHTVTRRSRWPGWRSWPANAGRSSVENCMTITPTLKQRLVHAAFTCQLYRWVLHGVSISTFMPPQAMRSGDDYAFTMSRCLSQSTSSLFACAQDRFAHAR